MWAYCKQVTGLRRRHAWRVYDIESAGAHTHTHYEHPVGTVIVDSTRKQNTILFVVMMPNRKQIVRLVPTVMDGIKRMQQVPQCRALLSRGAVVCPSRNVVACCMIIPRSFLSLPHNSSLKRVLPPGATLHCKRDDTWQMAAACAHRPQPIGERLMLAKRSSRAIYI